jgi:hypothetical protein
VWEIVDKIVGFKGLHAASWWVGDMIADFAERAGASAKEEPDTGF